MATTERKRGLHFSPNSSASESDDYVAKGDGKALPVDINSIKRKMTSLKEHASTQIQDLRGEAKREYNAVSTHIGGLVGSPHYSKVYAAARDIFGGIRPMQPGSVAAYFAGCSHKGGSYCSALCANSIPHPDRQHTPCDLSVVIGDVTNGKYRFRMIHDIRQTSDKGIIYLTSDKEMSPADWSVIKNFGLVSARVLRRYPDGKTTDITEMVDVGSKSESSRHSSKSSKSISVSTRSSSSRRDSSKADTTASRTGTSRSSRSSKRDNSLSDIDTSSSSSSSGGGSPDRGGNGSGGSMVGGVILLIFLIIVIIALLVMSNRKKSV